VVSRPSSQTVRRPRSGHPWLAPVPSRGRRPRQWPNVKADLMNRRKQIRSSRAAGAGGVEESSACPHPAPSSIRGCWRSASREPGTARPWPRGSLRRVADRAPRLPPIRAPSGLLPSPSVPRGPISRVTFVSRRPRNGRVSGVRRPVTCGKRGTGMSADIGLQSPQCRIRPSPTLRRSGSVVDLISRAGFGERMQTYVGFDRSRVSRNVTSP